MITDQTTQPLDPAAAFFASGISTQQLADLSAHAAAMIRDGDGSRELTLIAAAIDRARGVDIDQPGVAAAADDTPPPITDSEVEYLARALVGLDGDDWDDPALTPDTPRSRAEEFREDYRKAARAALTITYPLIVGKLGAAGWQCGADVQAEAAAEYVRGVTAAVNLLRTFDQDLPGFDRATCRRLADGVAAMAQSAAERLGVTQ